MAFGNALGGMLPGGGNNPPQGFAAPLSVPGQPVTLQPGQMPMAGENFQYAGFPSNGNTGVAGPVMTPGGGGTGAPMQGGNPPQGGFPGMHFGPIGQGVMGQFQNALMDWRQARPQFSYDPNGGPMQAQRQDWRTQMMDWRQQHPRPFDFMGGQPGGGQTPGGPFHPINVGMVPGVPGSMATNPAAAPTPVNPGPYTLPTY